MTTTSEYGNFTAGDMTGSCDLKILNDLPISTTSAVAAADPTWTCSVLSIDGYPIGVPELCCVGHKLHWSSLSGTPAFVLELLRKAFKHCGTIRIRISYGSGLHEDMDIKVCCTTARSIAFRSGDAFRRLAILRVFEQLTLRIPELQLRVVFSDEQLFLAKEDCDERVASLNFQLDGTFAISPLTGQQLAAHTELTLEVQSSADEETLRTPLVLIGSSHGHREHRARESQPEAE